ncbi:MAG: type VII secretion protein EssC [Firmicutes bacterium]|nr:type VII secretion protein EssC [Bacillota bacterium]
MLIYILHNDKYDTLRLPKVISGNFVLYDYDYNNDRRNLANIYGKDNKWFLNTNENINVLQGKNQLQEIELKYGFYTLSVANKEIILLYVAPGYDATYEAKSVYDNTSLIIGSDSKCDLTYTYINLAPQQLQLEYSANKWKFKNLNPVIPVYINGVAKVEATLNGLDTLFIMGLNIVFCGNMIFINNPFKAVWTVSNSFQSPTLEFAVPNYNTDISFNDFYETTEYFSKSPVFRKKFKTLKLTITSPEEKEKKDDSSVLMQVVPSALMSLTSLLSVYFSVQNYREGKSDKQTLTTALVMCVVMLLLSIAWPFIERFVMNVKRFINERMRIRIYRKYLKSKEEILKKTSNEQKMTLEFNNLSLSECQNIIVKRDANLFSVNYDQDAFLKIKLGTGRIPLDCEIDYTRPDFIKEKDKLLDDIDNIIEKYKYIENAPYTFSLKENVAFLNAKSDFDKYLNSIILQLTTFHDYYSLKLVVLTSQNSSLNNIRNLNHCWDNDRDIRFFATDIQDAENLSSYLIRVYNSRLESSEGNKTSVNKMPYYLIICDEIDRYRNIKIIDKVLHQNNNVGFSVVMFADKITAIPDGCLNFVDYNESDATLFKSQMEEKSIMKFKPELISDQIDFVGCMRLISNIPVRVNSEQVSNLPEKLGFLEMYDVGNVTQLNSPTRWKNAQVTNTLAAPIGVDPNGNILSLDLHEKKHGPHGLIAGMTGSGKSEFIITYILSLAVNYSPDEVQFVLIDYKGGGLAGAFENRKTGVKLPHLVGTITNLDKSSMHRTLVSINSELQRRQRIFNEAKETLDIGTIDIYKYQKLVREGQLKEPLAHLFIISDEFAELKAQQPDFMDELVSAARIGRSLGVHLILATQKPSGVVDDQIWSNSKFKVCCKVQTAEDSKEMIRVDDAAYIKESGRFYLQVGYDEIFVKGQSAYTGVQYVPSNVAVTNNKTASVIEFLDMSGNVIKSVVPNVSVVEKTADCGEELSNILKYLIECAKGINYTNRQLWLDALPDKLYIYDLMKKYPIQTRKFIIDPLIGEYDDPQKQEQGPVHVNLTEKGNLWISGTFGGGKTTLLSTILYSTITNYSSNEVNIYIVDLLAESLKVYEKAPQVGDFVSSSTPDKLKKLFHYLSYEVQKRKQYFSVNGGTFLTAAQSGQSPFSNILVFINGLDIFNDQDSDLFNDFFLPLIRDSNRVGVTFVATSSGSISVTAENSFQQKIALRYLDTSEYSMIFNDSRGIIPSSTPGRGLIELDQVYEFQTSLIFDDTNFDYNLKYVINQLSKCMERGKSIPVMPHIVTKDVIMDGLITLDNLPVGIDVKSNCVYNHDFSRFINLVLYSNDKMAVSFGSALISILAKVSNTKVIVLDGIGLVDSDSNENVQIHNSNFKRLCRALYDNILKKKSQDEEAEKIVFVVSGYSKLQKHLEKIAAEEANIKTIDDLIMCAQDTVNFKFILFNNKETLQNLDDQDWSDYFDSGYGIVMGMGLDDQEIIEADDQYDNISINKDMAVMVNAYRKNYVKYVKDRQSGGAS